MAKQRQEPIHSISSRPLYYQAIEAVVAYVRDNHLKPGDSLPGEDTLAKQLKVSRSTFREAMGILEREGLVIRKHGVGTFVAKPSGARLMAGLHQLIPLKQEAAANGIAMDTLCREVSLVQRSSDTLAAFPNETSDVLLRVQIVLGIDGQRTSYFDSVTPLSVIEPTQYAVTSMTTLEYILAHGHPKLSYTVSEVYAVGVTSDLAEYLAVPLGTPVLHMVETYFSDDDMPVMLSRNYHVTNRFNFRIVRQVVGLPDWLRLTVDGSADAPGTPGSSSEG